MLKNFLACILFSPTLAMANLEQSLVGKWECKGLENEYLRHTSDIEYRDDGIFTEHSVMHNWAVDDDFYQIDTIKVLSKWQVMGDGVKYHDGIVQSYVVDMPNYEVAPDSPSQNKDAILVAKAMMELPEVEKAIGDETISRIRFIDENTYIFAIDGIDDDFPVDVENNHCKRKI